MGIADNQPIVVHGIRSILASYHDIEIRFLATNLSEMFGFLACEQIDVLLTNDRFDGDILPDGVRMLARIQRDAPDTKVLIFGAHEKTYVISHLISSGAAGFVGRSKECFSDLGLAIRHVATQRIPYLPPSIANSLLYFSLTKRHHLSIELLSEKEMAVATLIRDGLSIAEISKRLCRSPKTISNQKNSAIKKLGVRNDVELAKALGDYFDPQHHLPPHVRI
ncbi:response regulator transcription factor [Burkholderia ambifaria]|uniref:response regulator transcription factor n=1 Tax=Burkholderia ambifaria TaxID=152480 RepID=UPI0018E08335|nr:response regulator transcription factor [Burkholderia ambifaria]